MTSFLPIFRAWLIKDKRMVDVMSVGFNKGYNCTEIYVDVPDFDPYNEIILKIKPKHRKPNQTIGIEWYVQRNDPFELLPYSGVDDIHGNKIFLYDVIKVEYGRGKVIFNAGSFMIQWIDDPEASMELLSERCLGKNVFRRREDLVKLGNSFQTPELLRRTAAVYWCIKAVSGHGIEVGDTVMLVEDKWVPTLRRFIEKQNANLPMHPISVEDAVELGFAFNELL